MRTETTECKKCGKTLSYYAKKQRSKKGKFSFKQLMSRARIADQIKHNCKGAK